YALTAVICADLQSFLSQAAGAAVVYTLSLHDALPISRREPLLQSLLLAGGNGLFQGDRLPQSLQRLKRFVCLHARGLRQLGEGGDRKSTRLNSSHVKISYAVFCLKKKTAISLQANLQI